MWSMSHVEKSIKLTVINDLIPCFLPLQQQLSLTYNFILVFKNKQNKKTFVQTEHTTSSKYRGAGFLAALAFRPLQGVSDRKPAQKKKKNHPEAGNELTCVGAPTNAKVPAGGNVHGLREVISMIVHHATTVFFHTWPRWSAAAAARHQSNLALLQVHILVY